MAIVIGGGVIGLTTALRLRERGHAVTVVAERLTPETTSDVAAAFWSPFEPATTPGVADWMRGSLRAYRGLAAEPGSGVEWMGLKRYFGEPEPDPFWRAEVDHFRRLAPAELPPGAVDGYETRVPRIDTPVHMPFLLERARAAGVRVERGRLERLTDALERDPVVVHCSGLGARDLADDPAVHPVRGQVARIAPPAGAPDEVRVFDDPAAPAYIVPRSGDLLLGGSRSPNDWRREPDPAETERIVARCADLCAAVAEPTILETRCGLRPGRPTVRLEAERPDRGLIVHNYGHGPSGYTLAWGCADAAADLCPEPDGGRARGPRSLRA